VEDNFIGTGNPEMVGLADRAACNRLQNDVLGKVILGLNTARPR